MSYKSVSEKWDHFEKIKVVFNYYVVCDRRPRVQRGRHSFPQRHINVQAAGETFKLKTRINVLAIYCDYEEK